MLKNKTQINFLRIAAFLLLTLACNATQRLVSTAAPIASPTISLPTLTVTFTPLPSERPTATRTPRPTRQPIACADDSCLDTCLTRINAALETHKFELVGGDYEGKGVNLNLVVYKVDNGELGKPTLLYVPEEFKPFQDDLEAQLLIWNYASALLPPEQLKWISEYDIFTDGPEDGLAWVHTRDIFDRSRWQLGIDITDAEDPVFVTYTLVHEFGHLITLNTDEIPQTNSLSTWYQNPATCKQFSIPEGCTNPDSYINRFYQKFWTSIFDEWLETVGEGELAAYVDRFYEDHEDQFVRPYAATNIKEDIAESFMHFVLDTKPRDSSIVSQKIRFFYEFPELVNLRKQMIQNICSYTQ